MPPSIERLTRNIPANISPGVSAEKRSAQTTQRLSDFAVSEIARALGETEAQQCLLKQQGQPWTKSWLHFADLVNGATLDFELSTEPNKNWATKPEDAPPSFDAR